MAPHRRSSTTGLARWLTAAGTVAAGTVVASSVLAHRRAATLGAPPEPPRAPVALVVLGYPSRRSGSDHPVQRWRVTLALQAAERYRAEEVVFCGAAVRNRWVEADQMAARAIALGLDSDRVRRETRSASTWQNVYHAAGLVPDAGSVLIVSDPLHATRARRYWLLQRPEDHDRVFVADVDEWFSGWWVKIPTAAIEVGHMIDERRRGDRRSRSGRGRAATSARQPQ